MAFSPTDFITAVRLAREVRRRFVDAPGQYRAIWTDIKNLSFLLEEVDDLLPYRELSAPREEDLQAIWKSCNDVLSDLSQRLEKCSDLDPNTKSKNGKIRIAWNQLRWKQSDFDDFRTRLASIVSAFNAFLTFLNSNVICEIKAGVDRLNAREDAQIAEQNRQNLLNWLGDTDYISQQQDILVKRQKGTGIWFLLSKEFRQWVDNDGETMLCSGIPGAGKTILTSVVIDHLQDTFQHDMNVGIVYFYFSYRTPASQTLEVILGSIVRQLLHKQTDIPLDILDTYERHLSNKSRPSLEELLRASRVAIEMHTKVFFVLDALDEYYTCNSPALFATITELFELQNTAHLNLLATTREISDITSRFSVPRCIWKEVRAHAEDIDAYIDARMPELLGGRIENYPELQAQVKVAILAAADGMFLLARLHMDTLRGPRRPGTLLQVLQNLPRGSDGLDETYEQAMERIETQSEDARDLAKSIIAWVVHAKTTLSIRELREALAIEPRTAQLNEDMRPAPEDIDSLCAGLITVDHNTEAVRLVHQSAQEFFVRKQYFPSAHEDIIRACLTYLSYDYFDSGTITEGVENRFWFYCFYKYAASAWGLHAKEICQADDAILGFLLGCAKALSECVQAAFWREYPYHWHKIDHKTILGVHIAAYLGLHRLFEPLIRAGQTPDFEDSEGRSPLCYAAAGGQWEAIRYLIGEQNVNPNHSSRRNGTPLCIAAAAGHLLAVEELMAQTTIDLNAKTGEGESPLMLAVTGGHVQIVRLLSSNEKVDLNVYTSDGRSALMLAAESKNIGLVKLLLSQDKLDYQARSPGTGRTALQNVKNPASLQLICHKYIQDGVVEDPSETLDILQRAAECGFTDITRQILSHDHFNRRLLSSEGLAAALYGEAAGNGHCDVLDILLSNFCADVDCAVTGGWNALFRAADNGHLEVVRLLVSKYHANPHRIDPDTGTTALIQAAREDHKHVAELLLSEYHVDPDAGKETGWTALTYAAHFGSVEVLELLLTKYTVNLDLKDSDGRTPLSYAADNPKMLMQLAEKTLGKIQASHGLKPDRKIIETYSRMWSAIFSHIPSSIQSFLGSGHFTSRPRFSDDTGAHMSVKAETETALENTSAQETIRALIHAKLVTECAQCAQLLTHRLLLIQTEMSSSAPKLTDISKMPVQEIFYLVKELLTRRFNWDTSVLPAPSAEMEIDTQHISNHLWNLSVTDVEASDRAPSELMNYGLPSNKDGIAENECESRTADQQRTLGYATHLTVVST